MTNDKHCATSLVPCALIIAGIGLAGCGGGSGAGGSSNNSPSSSSSYTVGGSVTGLTTGTSVTLQTSGASSLTVNDNGPFAFASTFASGSNYSVSVQTQPLNGTCSVTNATGSVTAANVGNISVSCVQAPSTVTVASIASPTAGDFVQLSASVKDALGNAISGQTVAWSSSDATVIRVTSSGLLMALGPGTEDRDLIRQPVILLKSPVSGSDFTPPTTNWALSPSNPNPIAGTVTFYPWAFDPAGIKSVQIFLDGALLGTATAGFARPDVVAVYPQAPLDCGYQFLFDSTLYSKGAHTLTAVVTDDVQITTTLAAPIVIS